MEREGSTDSRDDIAVIGVDIGGTNHTAALVDTSGVAVETVRGKTDRSGGPQSLLRSLALLIGELKAEARERDLTVAGIGVGFGGPIDYTTGAVVLSHHVEGWEGFPLRDEIASLAHLPVEMDNDANAGGLGELRFGAAKGFSDLVYYNIGTGIGGAVILDGRLRRGPASIAGELGHTTVQPGGPLCTCGQRGCLESVASGSAIARRMTELSLQWEGRLARAEDLAALLGANQPDALKVLDEVVQVLSISIRNVLHTLNPEVIVLGGGVSDLGSRLLLPLRTAVQAITFPAAYRSCRIVRAQLGYDAGVVGAASLALEALPHSHPGILDFAH